MRRRLIMGIVEANFPTHSAGHQYATLGWIEAFRNLGWDIWIVEEISRAKCVDVQGRPCRAEASIQAEAWRRFVREHGFEGRETLFVDGVGANLPELRAYGRRAEFFLNYSGQFHRLDQLEDDTLKVYLDVDPGYTQTWSAAYGCAMNFEGHDRFVNVGATIGSGDSPIPSCGRRWIPTLPPASTSLFRRLPPATGARPWTTVAHWYAGDEVRVGELSLQPKRDTFRALAHLPGLVRRPVTVACDLRPEWDEHREFSRLGWTFRDTAEVCGSSAQYRQFIADSAGEIGVPKGGYVAARTGWMSDRSMVYLAMGRPVVAMDTGWKDLIGESDGLRAFSTAEEAAFCIREIEADYANACFSARDQAEVLFSGPKVAQCLLGRLGIDPSPVAAPARAAA